MLHRFRLRGKGLRQTWEKECPPEFAKAHAHQVVREYANDDLYHGTDIVVTKDETEVAVIPVAKKGAA